MANNTRSRQGKGSRTNGRGSAGQTKPAVSGQGDSSSAVQTFLRIDSELSRSLSVCASAESSGGSLRPLMKFLEYSCHGVPWLAGTITAILMSHQASLQEKLVNLFLALILDCILVGLVKLVVRRQRPSHNKDDMFLTPSVDRFSFPSGHATRAALVSSFLVTKFALTPMLKVCVILWGAIVSCSRILLGRHHISDVFCGTIIGLMTYRIVEYYWLPGNTCQMILKPVFENLHL